MDAFAYNTCEREWQFDLAQFARRFLDQAGDLYGVVRLRDLPSEAGWPVGSRYVVVYAHIEPAVATAHALILSEAAVVAADALCGGAPAAFLDQGPPLFGPEVIFEGPAFDR